MQHTQTVCWLLGWLAVSSLVVCAQHALSSSVDKQFKTCYNSEDAETWIPGTFQGYMDGELARMCMHQVMWSTKHVPGEGEGPGLTIITASTISRLDSLAAQCRAWAGPLAATLYIPIRHKRSAGSQLSADAEERLRSDTLMAKQLFLRMEAEPSSCSLRLLLLYELVGDELLGRLLPINSLRNTAMLAATTELLAMVDVDLLPTRQLTVLLTEPHRKEFRRIEAICRNKKIVIMPAFETSTLTSLVDGQQVAQELVTGGNKPSVVAAASQGRIIPFAQQAYAPGHNATDFLRWYMSDAPYDVEYQINFEPWFIVRRDDALLYDARFRGYGWNKATQVAHHNMSGYGFTVHPDLFLIHRAHPRSDAKGVYNKASSKSVQTGHVSSAKLFHRRVATLRHVSIRQMRRGLYKLIPGTGVSPCMANLTWWAGLGPQLVLAQQEQQAIEEAVAAVTNAQTVT